MKVQVGRYIKEFKVMRRGDKITRIADENSSKSITLKLFILANMIDVT